MSKDFFAEEKLDKTYDHKLIKRLVSYIKPYKFQTIFSILLVLIIVFLELLQPYLVKIAIDDDINGIFKPMVAFEIEDAPIDGVTFLNMEFIREENLTNANVSISEGTKFQIVEKNSDYFLIETDLPINSEYKQYLMSDDDIILFRENDLDSLKIIAIIYLILLIIIFLFNYIQTYTLQYVGQKIIFNIRKEVFSHIQNQSQSFFNKNPVGRLVTRVTNDAEAVNDMYSNVIVSLIKNIVILIGIIIIMLVLNVKLALISFIAIPLILLSSFIYRKKARKAFRQLRTKLALINTKLNENLSGMKVIHTFHREEEQLKQFNEINQSHFNSNFEELKIAALFKPSMDLIYSLALTFILWFGAKDVLSGAIEFGTLYVFIDYIKRFFNPINEITEKYTIMQSAFAASERIFQLLDQKEYLEIENNMLKIEEIKGKIEFENVWFAYTDKEWILKDISFTINPGEMVAFVGATGAGKSSIINLLGRYYNIQKGIIKIDGIDINTIDKSTLRKKIGIVMQDIFLFSGDISSNISLDNPYITQEKIEQAAQYVNANKFIDSLPNKYNELVMERGATLSQGQRQLLSFARTLAYTPSILVLDEATASIDTETELLIQDALKKITKSRTTIIIAHRLSTIQHANKIIVLHKGEIIETGTHQELLSNDGLYYKLYQLQYKENFEKSI